MELLVLLWHALLGRRSPRHRLKEHARVFDLCAVGEAALLGHLPTQKLHIVQSAQATSLDL